MLYNTRETCVTDINKEDCIWTVKDNKLTRKYRDRCTDVYDCASLSMLLLSFARVTVLHCGPCQLMCRGWSFGGRVVSLFVLANKGSLVLSPTLKRIGGPQGDLRSTPEFYPLSLLPDPT